MAKSKPKGKEPDGDEMDSKGRGPSKNGYQNIQKGKVSPDRELQQIIAAKMGMDPMGAGPPARMGTMNNQLQAAHSPAVPGAELQSVLQNPMIQQLLQQILGGGAGGPPPGLAPQGGPPPGPPQLQDLPPGM